MRAVRAAGAVPAVLVLFLNGAAYGMRAQGAGPAPAKAPIEKSRPTPRIDINSASLAALKTLPGIRDAEAARIVAGRPYLSKADLVSSATLPLGIYLQIKDRIVAIQKPKAGAQALRR